MMGMFLRWGKKMLGRAFLFIICLILVGIVDCIMSRNTFATVKNEKDIYALSIYLGLGQCYQAYAENNLTPFSSGDGFDYAYFFSKEERDIGGGKFKFDNESASAIYIPTYVGSDFNKFNKNQNYDQNDKNRKTDSDLSCKQAFEGWGTTAAGIKQMNKMPASVSEMGYTENRGGDGSYSVSASFQDGSGYVSDGNSLSVRVDSEGMATSCSGSFVLSGSSIDAYKIECRGATTEAETGATTCIRAGKKEDLEGEVSFQSGWNCDSFYGGKSKEEIATSFKNLMLKGNTAGLGPAFQHIGIISSVFSNFPEDKINVSVKEGEVGEGAVTEYALPSAGKLMAAQRMLYAVGGVNENLPHASGDNYVVYFWNDAYKYSLFYHYLERINDINDYKGVMVVGGDGRCGDDDILSDDKYYFRNAATNSDTIPKWCEVYFNDDAKKADILGLKVSMPTSNGMKFDDSTTFESVLKAFRSLNYDKMKEDEYASINSSGGFLQIGTAEVEEPAADQGENASGTAAATCQSAAGAGALGWIVCPVVEWMGNSATNLYSSYVEPRLKINPKLFQTLEGRSENPTQSAWTTFQTIANVVFIILLLLVIFSQLTGVGIDNYGIKRILPKLIVVAILVNLSYLICVICVDLSNILGSSLKGLFDSLSAGLGDIPVNTTIASTGALGNDSWAPVLILGIIVTTIIVGAVSIAYNPAILLTLLFSAIGVIISVMFIFVLFAAREAAIVVLTVVSPIAFVCYALPNTKKAFDKWLKAWQGLLLVYPICGILIGGGDYISRLLIVVEGSGETGSWLQLIVAMVVGIIPIFFIPTLLKGSFAAMGNIGAKVAGVGKTLGGKATSRLTNSGVNKRLQQRGSERRTRVQAGVDRDGNIRELGRFGRFVRGGRHNIASSRAQYLSNQKTRNRENSLMGGGFAAGIAGIEDETRLQASRERTTLAMNQYRDMGAGEMQHEWEDAFRSGDTNRLDAITNVMNSRFGTTAANLIGQSLSGMNGVATNANYQASLRSLQQTMNDNSAFANNMKNKASDAFQMISDAGMHYDAATGMRTYEDLSYFSANNPVSTDIKDWSTQSTATLQRAIASGKLDNDMIQQILNSKDPSIQSGIQSDAGKRNLLQGQLYRSQNPAAAAGMSDDDAAQAYRDSTASAADWSGRSTADLQAAISSGTLSDDMVQNIVNSSDENVRTNLLNDPNKRDMLQAHVWNQQHPVPAGGVSPSVNVAAQNFRNAQNAPTIRSSGAYGHNITGAVVRLNEMSDGTFVNADTGATVDIRNYRRH